jgi:choline dehydrogenase-like flavoprotein
MFVDARDLPEGFRIAHDVCIVGSGPAGLTLGRELSSAGLNVAIIESGGLEYDTATQDLYNDAANPDYEPLLVDRLRYFGGSSNHWAGLCTVFGSDDFRKRSWVPHSGWPIGYRDVEPYAQKALNICTFGRGVDDWSSDYWTKRNGRPHQTIEDELFEMNPVQVARADAETRNARNWGISFGKHYFEEVQRSTSLIVYLYANVIDVVATPSASQVERLEIATLSGTRMTAYGKRYVLACGGVENARLLLASSDVQSEGLANSSGAVGRYFMDHPIVESARLLVSGTPHERGGIDDLWSGIRLRREVVEREGLANVILGFRSYPDIGYELAKQAEGVKSARRLARDFSTLSAAELARDIANVVADFDDVAARTYAQLAPGTIPIHYYDVFAKVDPAPNPDNRVVLSDARDPFGRPRASLTFRPSDSDVYSVARTVELLGREVGRLGYGRVQGLMDDNGFSSVFMKFGHHHMGTTRMHANPRKGVVDADCRTHDLDNLYMAGSSVFTTGGSGTPTLMIVTLALRLAEHISTELLAVA